MKRIILLVIIFLTTVNGFSKCGSSGLEFWPSGTTINVKSIFMIEGYATSQKTINELQSTHKAYLKSGEQRIALKVMTIVVGQFNLTQAILRPEENLTVGLEYELFIENLENSENEIYRYNYKTNQKEKIKWKVANAEDTTPPTWTTFPKFKNSTYQRLGCGPELFANFSFSATDDSELLIKTTVKNLSNGKETIYYLTTDKNIIEVGHGMCSGAFNLEIGDEFEVEFTLFDASGNMTAWKGNRIKFKKPS